MITCKLKGYTPREKVILMQIMEDAMERLMNRPDCIHDCSKCQLRVLCNDLYLVSVYLFTKVNEFTPNDFN